MLWIVTGRRGRTTRRADRTSCLRFRWSIRCWSGNGGSAVFAVCREKLLTPVGLRSLSPDHPDYKAQYHGDLKQRDAAYHQGTVWSWLIGPFVNCWLRLHPAEKETARGFLKGLVEHLGDDCIGSVSEVFDAEPPYGPRGCCAQAWGVAELLRCLVLTAPVAAE